MLFRVELLKAREFSLSDLECMISFLFYVSKIDLCRQHDTAKLS